MPRVYKTFFGRWIDLDALVSISDPVIVDKRGCGGIWVEFEMHFNFMENPIKHTKQLETLPGAYTKNPLYEFPFNEHEAHYTKDFDDLILREDETGEPYAIVQMRKKIAEILEAWKGKNEIKVSG